MPFEFVIFLIVIVGALLPLLFRPQVSRRWLRGVAMGSCFLAIVGGVLWSPGGMLPPQDSRPLHTREGKVLPERGFVSSNTCRSCHPGNYESWYSSFHRTMTQVVTPETVIADLGEVRHPYTDERYYLERRGDEFWVEMPDPAHETAESSENVTRVWRQLVMSTGSHHQQVYWYPNGWGRELHMFPFSFLKEERRWVPGSSVFLIPPGLPQSGRAWNGYCMKCHSTDGRAMYSNQFVQAARAGRNLRGEGQGPETRVAELGIGCEACHGPGEEHVKVNRNPIRRYVQRASKAADPSVVHPKRLNAKASAQICGQCHSINLSHTYDDEARWLTQGPVYRAGGDLDEAVYVLRPATVSESPMIRKLMQAHFVDLRQQFWPDGQIRLAGREYNGLIDSPCFEGGEFSCSSCHSMHDSDPDDQLAEGMGEDLACLQCHVSYEEKLVEHTHHLAESSGSRCYNCHMPFTTWGLMKGVRSHTVDSPSVAASVDFGRPNACNLCHLDKTLSWTADSLTEWYGTKPVELTEEQRTIAASLLWLLRGDAAQRALTASSMGWEAAQDISNRSWLPPFLALTLNDPYDVVRFVSARSLRTLSGYADFTYDFLWPQEKRVTAAQAAVDQWDTSPERTGSEVLVEANGNLRMEVIADLLRRRDNRPVELAE